MMREQYFEITPKLIQNQQLKENKFHHKAHMFCVNDDSTLTLKSRAFCLILIFNTDYASAVIFAFLRFSLIYYSSALMTTTESDKISGT